MRPQIQSTKVPTFATVLDHSPRAAQREARWESTCEAIFNKWEHCPDVSDDDWHPFLRGLAIPDRIQVATKTGQAHLYVSAHPANEVAEAVRELRRKHIDLRLVGLALAWGNSLQDLEPGFKRSKWRLREAKAEQVEISAFVLNYSYLKRLADEPGGLLFERRDALDSILNAVLVRKGWVDSVVAAHLDLGKVRAPRDAFARRGPVDRALQALGVPDYRDSYHQPPGPRLRSRLLHWQRDRYPSGIGGLEYKPRQGLRFPDYFWALIPRHRRRLLKEGRSAADIAFPERRR